MYTFRLPSMLSSSLRLCLWLYFLFAQGLKASQRQEIRAFLEILSVYVLLDPQDYVRPLQSSLWTMHPKIFLSSFLTSLLFFTMGSST